MLKDIERILEDYFPETWNEESVLRFTGKPRFARDVQAIDQTLNKPIRDFVLRGGKRLRPLLFLTLIKIFGKKPEDYLKIAFFIEMVHNSTLVIDDIEDDSELRRGLPTLHKTYGLDVAVNTGTAMHILPLSVLLQDKESLLAEHRLRIFEIYTEELINVYLGQATDIYWHKNSASNVKVDQYLEMCRLKTGSLMRVSARVACVLTDRDNATEAVFVSFAEAAGIAFQIKDDVLDLTAKQEDFGKSFGNDITEGKLSLPVILALQELKESDRERLIEILQMHTHDIELIMEARDLITKTKATEKALNKAEDIFNEAWQKVEHVITDEESRQTLRELTNSFIKRDR